MKSYKKIFFSGLALSGALFLVIPLMNLMGNNWKISSDEPEKLFSLDLIEGHVNFWLYQAGITGNFDQVIIGKKGWMFLGNQYSQVVDQTRGMEIPLTSAENIEKTIRALKQKQEWLNSKGIKTLFAIAPNKHSIYKEYLPEWAPVPDRNYTDDLVDKARKTGIHILDLRVPLIGHKPNRPHLYYKTGTHWNLLGGLIGYQEILSKMNRDLGMDLKSVRIDSIQPLQRTNRELSWFLKFSHTMIEDHEKDFYIKFDGMNHPVCLQDIDRKTLSFKGECVKHSNPRLNNEDFPRLVLNRHALNNLTLLWLTDSFATNVSRLFVSTFSRTFEIHHAPYSINQIQTFIETHKPDILLYLVVERNILNPPLQATFQE